ncbi:MAG: hypothetical protein CMI75_07145 [Candidatus Pelagibacter sp.]|nr:hypothetical protein [Candidatus Pelagibacter sp.]|tara:strand:+ start:428 stop:1645 length:1218 start_codon:yes stop_codon:yes gene_type:complete
MKDYINLLDSLWMFDVANALVCFLVTLIAWQMKKIPNWVAFVLAIYSFIPFFLNGLFLPEGYFNDQGSYTATLDSIRSGNLMGFGSFQTAHCHTDLNVDCPFFMMQKPLVTGWFLAVLPIPFVETISSMGFFNRFLFLVIFLWLYQKKFLRGLPLFFILFYPSLILYSSLSLRDMLVMSLMLVSIIFFIDKKYFKFFIVISPLYLLKIQNFYLMTIFFIIFIILKKQTLLYRIRYPLFGLLIIFIGLNLDDIIFLINRYRDGMFFEEYTRVGSLLTYSDQLRIEGLYDLITISTYSLPYFVMKPFPWEASGYFQFIQSIENILLLIFLIVFTKKAYAQNAFLTSRWILFTCISMTIYGLVVFNFGTSVRYKFPFMVIYVIGLSYELYKIYGYRYDQNSKKIKTTI